MSFGCQGLQVTGSFHLYRRCVSPLRVGQSFLCLNRETEGGDADVSGESGPQSEDAVLAALSDDYIARIRREIQLPGKRHLTSVWCRFSGAGWNKQLSHPPSSAIPLPPNARFDPCASNSDVKPPPDAAGISPASAAFAEVLLVEVALRNRDR